MAKPIKLSIAAVLLGVIFAATVQARPLTLSPVGNPIPGVGPVGLAVAETGGGTYAFVADYQGDSVRSLHLDPSTGTLSPIGSVPLPNGPSALAVTRDGKYLLATTLSGNSVTSFRLDPSTGTLSPIGSVPSGGNGPLSIDISDGGFVVVANRDSNNLGVLSLDRTGALTSVSSYPVGTGPATVKVSGNHVLVGHTISNDVHLLRLSRHGTLDPIDAASVGARVTSIAVLDGGHLAAVGTYPNGDVHTFNVERHRLASFDVHPTGGDITSLAFANDRTLFVTGASPARVAAFDLHRHSLQLVGEVSLTGLSSRTLTTVDGARGANFVIVNEYNNNRTLVIKALR